MTNRCCICFKEYEGYGNNAEPLRKGKCCDKCNNLVIDYRLNYEKPDFQEFEKRVKSIYDELDNKRDFYKLNIKSIENADNLLEIIKANCSIKADKLTKEIINKQKNGDISNFSEDILFEYVKVRACEIPIFEISNEVMELMNTKNRIYPRNMPYVNFMVLIPTGKLFMGNTNISLAGFIVYNRKSNHFFNDSDDYYRDNFFIKVILHNPDDEDKYKYVELSIKKNNWDIMFDAVKFKGKEQYIFNKIFNQTMELFVNFLDYLLHPQSVKVFYRHSVNNPNRIKKGKTPLNDIIKIEVGANLLRYITLNREKTRDLKIKIHVRGHYYSFRNKKRFKRIYIMKDEEIYAKGYFQRNDGLIAKWKLPFVKGEGELINKRRILK